MQCPSCYNEETKVIDSRVTSDGITIRRRRECLKCSFRFSTREEVEILGFSVIKRDNRKEGYSREKLIKGLKRAFEKRSITDTKFKKLINSIERDIQVKFKDEAPSNEIGKITMKHLRRIDKVAYIRFASVYRAFEDLETFQEELNKLISSRKNKNKKN